MPVRESKRQATDELELQEDAFVRRSALDELLLTFQTNIANDSANRMAEVVNKYDEY